MSDTRRKSSVNGRRRLSEKANRQHNNSLDVDVKEKLEELESDGEPVSIAETITSEEAKATATQRSNDDSDSKPEVIDVTLLQKMSATELSKVATQEGVANTEGKDKRDLIFLILKERVKTRGIMCGHGTLQILPDGFGFLRSPEYHYLNCPDDIYVSPSQIRKFNLKNGAVVKGQIRPPKENERYFALLRVDPSESAKRPSFDELTPLHPDTRIVMEHNPKDMSTRVVDMIAPIGFGQRGFLPERARRS